MKKRIIIGLALGAAAGVIDVIPMMVQRLSWDANYSAFALWVVSGVLVASVRWNIKPVIKGIIIPLLVLAPSAVLIGWKQPLSLIPIGIMTVILGAILGFVTDRILPARTH